MPVIERDGLQVDFTADGSGTPVVLLHSSVSGNRQWRRLAQDLKGRFRVLALNLYGYGETTAWSGRQPQTLADQARLVKILVDEFGAPAHLVGHSFGGAVAMKAAALLGTAISRLVLLETNPFYLLRQNGRDAAYAEIKALRDHVKEYGASQDWTKVAERFAEYWNGPGSWEAMPTERRTAFAQTLAPNFNEWDAVMNETTPLAGWSAITAKTLLVCGRQTVRPIAEIAQLLRTAFPRWSSATIDEGGHMAPLTRPELVNPIVKEFLIGAT